jgi:hypothetical protein
MPAGNAVGPGIDVVARRQIALLAARIFVLPFGRQLTAGDRLDASVPSSAWVSVSAMESDQQMVTIRVLKHCKTNLLQAFSDDTIVKRRNQWDANNPDVREFVSTARPKMTQLFVLVCRC